MLKFHWSLISRILQIFNRSWKYFNENFWHAVCSVCVQWLREITSTKSSQIALHENLDPQKFSTIQYYPLTNLITVMIQTSLHTHLECKDPAMCMELSTRHIMHHSDLLETIMFPVLCAMLQWGWQSQWSQLKFSVHQHGFWSTLATLCQTT